PAHAPCHFVDHAHQVEAHRQLINAGFIHVTRNTEQTCAAILGCTKACKIGSAIQNDGWNSAERLDIVQNRRTLVGARYRRKGWTDSRNAALAFERFEQRRFLAALISARAGVRGEVKSESAPEDVFAQIPVRVRLI